MGSRFSAPIQIHPAYYTMGNGSLPGAKRPGRGIDHPPSSSAEVEGRVELYISLSPLDLRGLFYSELYLFTDRIVYRESNS
jgi:hypothetical protein